MKKAETSLVPQETIEGKILLIRSKKVMLDRIWLFFMALLQAI